MKTILSLTLVALLALPQAALPSCHVRQAVVVQKAVQVVEKVVVKEVIPVATFVPVAVTVPVYGVGYAPGYVPAPSAVPLPQAKTVDCETRTRELEAQLQELRRRLDQLQGDRPVPPAEGSTPRTLQILAKNCVSCHGAGVALDKGRGNVLFDANGRWAVTDPTLLRKVASSVFTGRMPQAGPKLSDEEVSEVVSWIDQLK